MAVMAARRPPVSTVSTVFCRVMPVPRAAPVAVVETAEQEEPAPGSSAAVAMVASAEPVGQAARADLEYVAWTPSMRVAMVAMGVMGALAALVGPAASAVTPDRAVFCSCSTDRVPPVPEVPGATVGGGVPRVMVAMELMVMLLVRMVAVVVMGAIRVLVGLGGLAVR